LLELRFVDGYERGRVIECAVCSRLALFKLGSQKGKGLPDRVSDIYSAGSWGCGGCEAAEAPDKVIDSRDLSNDNLGEVVSKLLIVVPLSKKFRECPYRDERVLDLMSHT
jgi:hypothetical protein